MNSVEVENGDGDPILAFQIEDGEVTETKNCDVADIEGDYIFQTDNELIRIQAKKPETRMGGRM